MHGLVSTCSFFMHVIYVSRLKRVDIVTWIHTYSLIEMGLTKAQIALTQMRGITNKTNRPSPNSQMAAIPKARTMYILR